ncbi:HesB/IscA family protein [Leptolyngbya sp. PCC 6406]|uniref:HesB/IscA family protein n=1 Tax=Leptolyngbya sp. PCC 6406 TaxID=1173264 RepID=UPI0002AC161D|nr:iron-sulfur cluster assembly accessory protein [Leptolyngbya sp. PCC 6406]
MIQFSQSALREIKRLQSRQAFPNGVVRLAIAAGGCAGLQYHLSFDEVQPTAADQTLTVEGIKVVVGPETLPQCDGMTVDYAEDLMGGNFRFTNPLAKHTCGCGVSFSREAPPAVAAADCTTVG